MDCDTSCEESFKVTENKSVIRVDFLKKIIDASTNIRRAQMAASAVVSVLEAHSRRDFCVLVDMSHMGESYIPLQANRIYIRVLKEKQIKKVAIVGNFKTQFKVLSFLTPFIVGKGKKVVWFPNTAEALLWLEKQSINSK